MNIPEGYMENAQGHLVPVAQVRPIDKARDEFVKETVAKAREVQRIIRDFKRESMSGISRLCCSFPAERYGAKIRPVKRVTSPSKPMIGSFALSVRCPKRSPLTKDSWRRRRLLTNASRTGANQAPGELRAVVEQAFRVNKEGRINTNAVLALRKLNISDERWMNAMQAIGDSLTVADTKPYIRVYERDEFGKYHAIPLDMAAL